MQDKKMHKLGKTELLTIIYEQQKEIEKLKSNVEDLEKQLENKTINLKEAGSIAEASLKLNKIFEAAQEAADQYLSSIKAVNSNQGFQDNAQNITKDKNYEDGCEIKKVIITEKDNDENYAILSNIDVEANQECAQNILRNFEESVNTQNNIDVAEIQIVEETENVKDIQSLILKPTSLVIFRHKLYKRVLMFFKKIPYFFKTAILFLIVHIIAFIKLLGKMFKRFGFSILLFGKLIKTLLSKLINPIKKH